MEDVDVEKAKKDFEYFCKNVLEINDLTLEQIRLVEYPVNPECKITGSGQ